MTSTVFHAESSVREDCGGIIPTISDWLSRIPVESWMNRSYQK